MKMFSKNKNLQTQQVSDQSLLFHQNNRKASRGKKIASTILLVISGVLLYSENILGLFFNLEIEVPNFIILKNFIYALSMSISPIIIIFASRMIPFRLAYLVPLYAYLNMLIGNIILILGYQIFDFWWYRLLIAATAVLVYFVLNRTIKYYDGLEMQERLKDKLIKSYQKQYDEE